MNCNHKWNDVGEPVKKVTKYIPAGIFTHGARLYDMLQVQRCKNCGLLNSCIIN